jgi:hypothetical protein
MIYKITRFFYLSQNEKDQDISAFPGAVRCLEFVLFFTFVKITCLLTIQT